MSKKKNYDDDDGRVVADMSGIERQPLIIPRFDHLKRNDRDDVQNGENEAQKSPWDDTQMSKSERSAFIGGALAAGLGIAAVFIAIFGIVIFLMTRM